MWNEVILQVSAVCSYSDFSELIVADLGTECFISQVYPVFYAPVGKT